MSDADMCECPADGCDYSGPKRSVLGHYSGKQDDAHAGGYADAKQQLGGAQEQSTEGGYSTTEPAEPQFPSGEGSNQEAGGNNLFGACPACGSDDNAVPADKAITLYQRHGVELKPGHRAALQESDCACLKCGKAYTTEGEQ